MKRLSLRRFRNSPKETQLIIPDLILGSSATNPAILFLFHIVSQSLHLCPCSFIPFPSSPSQAYVCTCCYLAIPHTARWSLNPAAWVRATFQQVPSQHSSEVSLDRTRPLSAYPGDSYLTHYWWDVSVYQCSPLERRGVLVSRSGPGVDVFALGFLTNAVGGISLSSLPRRLGAGAGRTLAIFFNSYHLCVLNPPKVM